MSDNTQKRSLSSVLSSSTLTTAGEVRVVRPDIAVAGLLEIDRDGDVQVITKSYGNELPVEAQYEQTPFKFTPAGSTVGFPVTLNGAYVATEANHNAYVSGVLSEKDLKGRHAECGKLTEKLAAALGMKSATWAEVFAKLMAGDRVQVAAVYYPKTDKHPYAEVVPLSKPAMDILLKQAAANGGIIPDTHRSAPRKPKGGAAAVGAGAAKEEVVE